MTLVYGDAVNATHEHYSSAYAPNWLEPELLSYGAATVFPAVSSKNSFSFIDDFEHESWLMGKPAVQLAATRDWMLRRATTKLARLTLLQPGWDGHRGAVPSFATAASMLPILHALVADGHPTPQVTPESDGSIRVEWLVSGRSLNLEVDREGLASLWLVEADGDVTWEAEFSSRRLDSVVLRNARALLEEMGRGVKYRIPLR